MANIKQQKKRVGIASRQRLENLRYRSTIKTLAKRLETAVADGDDAVVAAQHRAGINAGPTYITPHEWGWTWAAPFMALVKV